MWIDRSIVDAVLEYEAVSSRILVVRFRAVLKELAIVQVYVPSADKDEEEHDCFFPRTVVYNE